MARAPRGTETDRKIPADIRVLRAVERAFPKKGNLGDEVRGLPKINGISTDSFGTSPSLGLQIGTALKAGQASLFDDQINNILRADREEFTRRFDKESLGTVNWTDAVTAGLVSVGVAGALMAAITGSALTISGAIELLKLNGVDYPGTRFTSTHGLGGLEGDFVVKAAVPTKKKADKGMVQKCSGDKLESTVVGVLDAMKLNGEDPALGVIVQPLVAPGVEMLVSVKNTPYGTETTVKLGGELAEERTTTIRFIGETNEAELASGLASMRGVPKNSSAALMEVIKGLQKTASRNLFIDLIECNPVICGKDDNTAVPVDVRLFGRDIPETVRDIMPQEEFNRQMDRMLDPKIAVFMAPAGDSRGGVKYLMTLNADDSKEEGRQIIFVDPKIDALTVTLEDGSVVEKKIYRSLQDVVAQVGVPDLVVAPLRPDETIATAEFCSEHKIPLVMIGAGYGELGEAGEPLKKRLQSILDRGRIVAMGPNTVGVFDPTNSLDASFLIYGGLDNAKRAEGGGGIGLTVQSGGMLTEISSALEVMGVPMSHGVAIGNGYGVRPHQVMAYNDQRNLRAEYYYLEADPGKAFIDSLKERTPSRGIVILKGGRFNGNPAARSHTDSISGSSATFERAAKDAGAIVVERSEVVPLVLQMVDTGMARRLAEKMINAKKEGRPEPGIEVITQSGGDGVTSVDLLIRDGRVLMAKPATDRIAYVQKAVRGFIRVNDNPIDAGPQGRIGEILQALDGDPNIGLYLVLVNKFFGDSLIPLNSDERGNSIYFNSILVLTNDPRGKVLEFAKQRNWLATHDKQLALEALYAVYEYARFLAAQN